MYLIVYSATHEVDIFFFEKAKFLLMIETKKTILYLLQGSGQREARLHHIQEILDEPQLTIKEVHSVRWLSYFQALTAVYRSLDSLMFYFSESSDKDFKASGLRKKVLDSFFHFVKEN